MDPMHWIESKRYAKTSHALCGIGSTMTLIVSRGAWQKFYVAARKKYQSIKKQIHFSIEWHFTESVCFFWVRRVYLSLISFHFFYLSLCLCLHLFASLFLWFLRISSSEPLSFIFCALEFSSSLCLFALITFWTSAMT